MLRFLWRTLIAPRSKDKDRSRREFILNIFLVGLIILSLTAFFINVIYLLFNNRTSGENPITAGIISGVFIILLIFSRRGKSYIAAILLITILLIVTTYLNFHWGAGLSVNLLFFALTIVMAGILISTRSALLVTILSAISILLFTDLEIQGFIHPDQQHKLETIRLADSIVHIIILTLIASVSWLFNREGERALIRARESEAALQRQNEKLEEIIESRTKQLKEAQIEKVLQLYRFAEFGKVASGLFHDLVNPLTLTSLNLTKLEKHMRQPELAEAKVALDRAMIGTKRLETFIKAARKQVQNKDIIQAFSVDEEIRHAIQIFAYRAKKEVITIKIDIPKDITIYGNPLKFNQLITNLLANAIDAYENTKKNGKRVEIRVANSDNMVILTVEDWGSGIKKTDLPKIFDPLFTTKNAKGTGIGLSICNDFVKKDLGGTMTVISEEQKGSIFTVTFPIKKLPEERINK